MQRNKVAHFSLVRILFIVAIQALLSGCSQVSTSPTITAKPANLIPSTLTVDRTAVPTLPSETKLADIPENCNLAAFSPSIEWMTVVCGGIFKVAKFGSTQWTTLSEGDIDSVAFSPDSKELLVRSSDSLELMNVGDWQASKTILHASDEGPINWAPDSQSLAINYLEEGYALSIVHLDGSIKNLLSYADVGYVFGEGRDGFGPTWSPDSKKIAYVSPYLSQDKPVQIYSIVIATGNKELIYAARPGELGSFPVWSPDGSKIAVGTFLNGSNPIYVYDLIGKTFAAIGEYTFGDNAAWSPDSKYLAICDHKLHVISMVNHQDLDLNQECSIFLYWYGNDRIVTEQGPALYSISLP